MYIIILYITVSPVAVGTLVFIELRTVNVQRQASWRTCCDRLCTFNPQFLSGEQQESLPKQAMGAQTDPSIPIIH